jgi:Trk K+ transport system NAD-binding subunit
MVRLRVGAARHHVVALLREFRGPIFAFLVVTIVGGLLYGELYQLARGVRIPLIDRPYIMVQLMVLEAPESPPPEWYLVVFWYALPALFVILVAQGAADFVQLFFNRSEDRDAWGEALAMTYRNHVVVLGAGHVGLRVARDLTDMGREVVVVDHSPGEEAMAVLSGLNVPVVRGDGRKQAILDGARIAEAEAFVACTADDQVNQDAAFTVRDLNPNARVVVRMWDPASAGRLQRILSVHAVLSAADLSAPAFAGAAVGIDITQTLVIGSVEYSTVRLEVAEGSFMEGQTIRALQEGESMDIVLHRHGQDSTVQPGPDLVVAAGDDLVIFARHDRILDVVSRNRG